MSSLYDYLLTLKLRRVIHLRVKISSLAPSLATCPGSCFPNWYVAIEIRGKQRNRFQRLVIAPSTLYVVPQSISASI